MKVLRDIVEINKRRDYVLEKIWKLSSQVVRIRFNLAVAVENWSPTFILSAYFLSFFLPAKIPSESCLSS